MGIAHAIAGQKVSVLLPGSELGTAKTTALVKTGNFETIRMCINAGKEIAPHKAKGPITVQCLQGKVVFTAGENENEMVPGDWLYLEGGQIHSLLGIENSVMLVTIMFS